MTFDLEEIKKTKDEVNKQIDKLWKMESTMKMDLNALRKLKTTCYRMYRDLDYAIQRIEKGWD